MKHYSKIKITLGLIIGLVTLYYAFSHSYQSLNRYVLDSKIVSKEYEFSIRFAEVARMWKQAEISELNYLLTQKDRHLEPYNKYKVEIWKHLAKLTASDNPSLNYKMHDYEQLLKYKFFTMDQALQRRGLSLEDSLQIVFTGEGKEASKKLEAKNDEVIIEMENEIQKKIDQAKASSLIAKRKLIHANIVGVLLFILGMVIILMDVVKRQRYETELDKARAEAIKASHFKSNFLASTSHEIRTPLNSMIGMTDLLEDTNLDAEQKHLVETFKRSGESLLRIVNDILDLSKIEAGELSFEKIEFSLSLLLQDIHSIFKPKAEQKGLDIKIENNIGENIYLIGDPTRTQQILMNLVGNAIKFTSRGYIKIIVKSKGEKIYFSIIDTGIGIPVEKIKEIFIPYRQAESSTTRKFGGTGLGLSITKKIVRLMGGNIRVTSKLNEGSCFSFHLPVQVKQGQSHLKPSKESDHIQMDLSNVRILVTDDVADNRDLIFMFLNKLNPTLLFAKNGIEAIETFKTEDLDLILMDVQMPEMNGLEATKQIRSIEKISGKNRTPIIALTAQAYQKEIDICLEVGCDLHITKPIKKEKLIAEIQKFVIKNKVKVA